MQKFQDLLTQAAQLKQQQLKQQRKNFEALPQYLKSGLNYAKKYIQLRKQHYLVQKYISEKLKKQGNDQYLLQNYSQALSKYQQGLSVFRYIHASKYENLKDQDIMYENYSPQEEYRQEHNVLLVALYLNICSALTKMNKKQQAIHSSQQAMKIDDNNAKIYYKKAQAYLQYINRTQQDIKLGFYYLNKAYQLSKDHSILTQMHKIKKQLDQQRQKQKSWFKFMFQKQQNHRQQVKNHRQQVKNNNSNAKDKQKQKENSNKSVENNNMSNNQKSIKMKQQFHKFIQQQQQQNQSKQQHNNNNDNHNNNNHQQLTNQQLQRLQRIKYQLKPYLIIPRDDRWLIKYQQDFIHKHGSKIYSILQLSNEKDYLIQFKTLLAKCLQLKQAKITPQRDQNQLLQQKIYMYAKFIEWIKINKIDKYQSYIVRYQIETQWISKNRNKPIDQVYEEKQQQIKSTSKQSIKTKQKQTKEKQSTNNQSNENNQQQQKQLQKQTILKDKHNKQQLKLNKQQLKVNQNQKKSKSKKDNNNTKNKFIFKQQWQYQYEKQHQHEDKQQKLLQQQSVPQNIKAYLQNYQQLPIFTSHKHNQNKQNNQKSKQNHHMKQHKQQQQQNINIEQQLIKQNPLSFIKTFIIIIVIVALVKVIF